MCEKSHANNRHRLWPQLDDMCQGVCYTKYRYGYGKCDRLNFVCICKKFVSTENYRTFHHKLEFIYSLIFFSFANIDICDVSSLQTNICDALRNREYHSSVQKY